MAPIGLLLTMNAAIVLFTIIMILWQVLPGDGVEMNHLAFGVIYQQGGDSACTQGKAISLGNNMSMIVQMNDEQMGPTIHIGPHEKIKTHASSSCQNGGTLIDHGYTCSCTADFYGIDCEKETTSICQFDGNIDDLQYCIYDSDCGNGKSCCLIDGFNLRKCV